MKFECNLCEEKEPCVLIVVDEPTKCPFSETMKPRWKKVTEPAALPKLTAEELDRRGIEWPEWAVCVVVSPSEWGLFASKVPSLSADKAYWIGGGLTLSIASGKWDATDWMNSKIMRPGKVEEPGENRFTVDGVEYEAVAVESGHCSCCDISSVCPNVNHPPCANGRRDKRTVYFRKVKQLPDWLKLGAWAAVGKFVGKIDWISRDASECRITCGELRFAKTAEVKPVTWRAWTAKEAELQVGKAFRFKKTGYIGVMLGFHKDRGAAFPASGEHHNVYFASLDEILEQGEQLSGLPCGVPQVEGKDLEG